MNKLVLTLSVLIAVPTWASYQRLAECYGRTEKNVNVRAVLFVNTKNDSQGYVTVSIDRVSDSSSETKIDWTGNPQGYPRIYDNSFDLDIVIDDKNASYDDILVERDYIPQLQCRYTPKT